MAALLRSAIGGGLQQQLLSSVAARFNVISIFPPRFTYVRHCSQATGRHADQQRPPAVAGGQASTSPQHDISARLSSPSSCTPAASDYTHDTHYKLRPPRPHPPCKAKRIHIVDCSSDDVASAQAPSSYALRLRSPRDFRRMLSTSGLLCLVPAQQDSTTKEWRLSGDGTRCFSDLRENTFYMAMSAVQRGSSRPSATNSYQSLQRVRRTVIQVRNELTNRAFGEEGEVTESLLRIFCKEAGFPNMLSKSKLRDVENEEVDAVLMSAHAVVIGFHCNKLTHREATAALKRVSRWAHLASTGSSLHSFLLGKDIYVVLSGNWLPAKEHQHVISYCQKHGLMLVLKNGVNFSLHNSLLPPQHIVPANLCRPTTTDDAHEKKQQF